MTSTERRALSASASGPVRPTSPVGPVRLALRGRTLLLVAGMPGAGKSTLLAGLPQSSQRAVATSVRLRTEPLPRRWDSVTVLDRAQAATGLALDVPPQCAPAPSK